MGQCGTNALPSPSEAPKGVETGNGRGPGCAPIPNGDVVRGDLSVGIGWSWHIDPSTFEFADATTEVCDGKSSYVKNDTITGDYFCPWSAEVVGVELANH